MAKKKTTKTTTKKSPAKPAATRRATKKSPTKKSPTKKAPTKKSPAKKSSGLPSVDAILKSYDKERVTLNTGLTATRKKIEKLVKSLASLKAELMDAQAKEAETETAIATVDQRRDKEIGELLNNLGVNLDNAISAAKQTTPVPHETPLFDNDSDADEAAEAGDKQDKPQKSDTDKQ